MLILCSDGLSSKHLQNRTASAVRHCQTAALVVTADHTYKEKNYHVPRCIRELELLGLHVEIFDLDKQNASLLKNYDVVEFIGGNPYYLLNAIRTQDCSSVLHYLAKEKVLIGWSAAAFVFGPTLALADQYTPEMNFLKLSDLSGLALTQCMVLPHYSKFLHKLDRFEEICTEFETTHCISVLRLNDGDGIFIDGSRIELCRA
ncbi:MAG: Type 1 glutamine amidotransferase-like domain-containing protein [Oscillospiraceae bacterium]|nr:Type 1 glutamine amidotransferase-like domain-containing protein [Oscillospiraceae bacterium]